MVSSYHKFYCFLKSMSSLMRNGGLSVSCLAEGMRVHSSQVPALISRWDRAVEGGGPQSDAHPSPRFPHCTFSFHNASITETSNSIQDMPRWTKPKDLPLLRIHLSPLHLSVYLGLVRLLGRAFRGWNSPQAQKVSETGSHIGIRRGVWGQCWPKTRGGRNLFPMSRWDYITLPWKPLLF